MSGEWPDDVVFDEEFVASASIHEPSARRRRGIPLLRRLARRRARSQRIASPPPSPQDWRLTEPRRRGAAKPVTTVLILVGLISVVAVVLSRMGGTSLGFGGSPHNPAETAPVTNGAVPTIQLDRPFAGSPAESFAEGAAGIAMQGPAAMGEFSKDEVDRAYRRTRKLVAAGQLDRKTLLGGSPDAYAALLDPLQRDYFIRHLNDRDMRRNTRSWVTSFAPGTAELAGDVVKVNGTMKAYIADDNGNRGIMVELNYLFVYPVYRPGYPETLTRIVAHYEARIFHYRAGGGVRMWVLSTGSAMAPARCGVKDGFVHPSYPGSSEPNEERPIGPAQDPYSLEPERKDGSCETSGRT